MVSEEEAQTFGRRYAPLMEKMIEILGAKTEERITFKEAMDRASRETGVVVAEEHEGPILMLAFRVIGSGKIPGLPEA